VGDAARLAQVLVNLLSNAAKFTCRGEIVVELGVPRRPAPPPWPTGAPRPAGDHAETKRRGLRYTVRDTGTGIPAHMREAVFESFTQADSSASRRVGGTGLGLAISRGLVERMGGTLTLDSIEGRGSTFIVDVPLEHVAPQSAAPAATDADVALPLGGLRLLVVDDHGPTRLSLAGLLREDGAEAVAAGSVAEALEATAAWLAQGREPDLVLVDECLPDMAAWEARPPEATSAPVLPLLTTGGHGDGPSGGSSGGPSGGRRGFRAGLIKPAGRADLREAVLLALGRGAEGGGEPERFACQERPLEVLLVEDAESNRMLVDLYLGSTPHRLTTAVNGREALDLLRVRNFDIVLMDMEMPVLDGYAATAALRDMERKRDARPTPVLALTAHAYGEALQRCLDAGCDGYLTKPVRKDVLLDALHAYTLP
jgi:CheY-like chemotaxis protein